MLFSSRNNQHSIKEFTLHSLSGSSPSPITISLQKILIIKVLRQKKVGGQILIFFTSEVGLDHKVFRKSQSFQLKSLELETPRLAGSIFYPLNCLFVLGRDLNNTGLVQEISGTFSRQSSASSLSLTFLGLVDHSNKILLVLNKSRVRNEKRNNKSSRARPEK